MTKEYAIRNILATYSKHGVTEAFISEMIESGMNKYGMSLEACYNGLRIILAEKCGEHELFTLSDVQAITGESKEELLQRIDVERLKLIEEGKNPDEYFKPINTQATATYLYTHGI